MAFVKRLKKLIKASDFFYSTEMLRYDDDLQFKTMTGGVVSLAIIITIIIGFASMIMNTLDLNSFTITTEKTKNVVPTLSTISLTEDSPFRFALQIWRYNLTANTKRYFDVTFRLDYQNYGNYNTTTYLPLEPCTKEYFKKYPEIADNFQTLEAETWLCPSLNTTLYLEGKYSSANYNQYVIQASTCKNETDPSRPCASPEQISAYFKQRNNYFYFSIYYVNTQINPDKKDYKHYYIEDISYALFGSNLGSEVFLEFTDYTVQTDYSIWPFSTLVSDSGCYTQTRESIRPFQTDINGTYISWSLVKSSNSVYHYRQVQKLSIIFSFMGGMIGAISALLFIVKMYTTVAFQFSIAFDIFKQKLPTEDQTTRKGLQNIDGENKQSNDDKTPAHQYCEQISMNFFTFIQFYAWQLLHLLGCKYDSPKMKYAKECKDQILRQLDVKQLLKRIIFIEHCITKILDDYHLDALQIKVPQTPHQVRQIRLKCECVVDQQLSEAEKKEEQAEECQNKQAAKSKASQSETPHQLNTSKQHSSYINLGLVKKKSTVHANFQDLQIKNQLVILDIQNDKEDKRQDRHGSRVFNSYMQQKKRKTHLLKLLLSAEEGNQISNTIWKKLDKQTKKIAVGFSKEYYQ